MGLEVVDLFRRRFLLRMGFGIRFIQPRLGAVYICPGGFFRAMMEPKPGIVSGCGLIPTFVRPRFITFRQSSYMFVCVGINQNPTNVCNMMMIVHVHDNPL